jgi:hypothetical protein
MPLVKNVEKRIWDIEHFDVIIRHVDGRDMRGDKTGLPQYPASDRAARNSWTVSEWKAKKFLPTFPGYEVDVLDGTGQAVHGLTLLSTVRDSYSEDE